MRVNFTHFGPILFLAVLSFLPKGSHAQELARDYFFSTGQAVFTPISGGTELGSPASDDQLFNGDVDGVTGSSTDIGFPIGFDFTFAGVTYSSFAVSNNGYIKLGNGTFTITGSTTAAFTSTFDSTTQQFLIGGLHMDLKNQPTSKLSFTTVGTVGNRELIVEWLDFKSYEVTSVGDEHFNFQIRLLENGNRVVIHYGDFIKNATDRTPTVGIKGEFFNDVHLRKIVEADGDEWANSQKSTLPATKADLKENFIPGSGLTFTFSPPIPLANDAGVLGVFLRPSILTGCPAGASESMKIAIRNFGTNAQSSIPYVVVVNGQTVLNETASFSPALPSGQTDTIDVTGTLDLSTVAQYSIKVATKLNSDTGLYVFNDTARVSYRNFGSATTPTQPVNNFTQYAANGWRQFRGATKPTLAGGYFVSSSIFYSQTTASFQSTTAGSDRKEWLVSPTFLPNSSAILKFRAAITGTDSSTAPANIADDEIKVMVSTDCGATWQALKTFNNASVTGGELGKAKVGYQIALASITSPFQIAFFVNDKGTPAPTSYYFHLDDVVISLGNAYDLATIGVAIDNQSNPGCSLTAFPVKVKVKNVGDSAISSFRVQVRVNSVAPLVQTFTPTTPILKGDSSEVIFNNVPLAPNNTYKIAASSKAILEDGYSAANDSLSTQFNYIGSANPLALPNLIDFNSLTGAIPNGWLVDQKITDFRLRNGRGVGSTKALSANISALNSSSFAVMPVTQSLPAGFKLNFAVRFIPESGASYQMKSSDSLVVQVTNDCGASFTTVFRIDSLNQVGIANFENVQVDLSAFEGQSVSVRYGVRATRSDFLGVWVDLDDISFSPLVSTANVLEANQVQLIPNPATDKVRIQLSQPKPSNYIIRDAKGRDIFRGTIEESATLDFSTVSPGVYLVEIQNPEGVVRKKLVIQ